MGQIKEQSVTLKNLNSARLLSPGEEWGEKITTFFSHLFASSLYTLTSENENIRSIEVTNLWLTSSLNHPNDLTVVCVFENEIIGHLSFTSEKRIKCAHSGDLGMGVHKNWRGQGVGEHLLRCLLSWSHQNPTIHRIGLSVMSGNTPAFNLYQKLGFQKEARRPKAFRLTDGSFQDEICMAYFPQESNNGSL